MLHVKVSVGRGLVVVEEPQRNHLSENCVRDVLNLHITSSSFLIPFFFFFLYLRAVVPFGLPFLYIILYHPMMVEQSGSTLNLIPPPFAFYLYLDGWRGMRVAQTGLPIYTRTYVCVYIYI